jgi:hypothetical protein
VHCFLGIFWCDSVFHAVELFHDAHSAAFHL